METNHKMLGDQIRHLANQLIRNRLGQWPHISGVKTILTVKFLCAEDNDQMKVWPEVKNPGPFTSEEKCLAMAVLSAVEQATGLSFTVVEKGPAQLTFGQYEGLIKEQYSYHYLDGYADIYSVNPNPYDRGYKDAGVSVESGNFSGPIPIWIRSSAALGPKKFKKNVAHELGHALGLAHLPILQEKTDGSVMIDGRILNTPNDGFGKADLLAFEEIYSLDKHKPIDLFHTGLVYYAETYGHASVFPVGCGQFGYTVPYSLYTESHKENQVIRLRKGITKDRVHFELVEGSEQVIKMTFIDNPNASLTIEKLSEPLMHKRDWSLRFKRIKLANGDNLSIDDQLYQTLESGKQPLWQKGRSLVTPVPKSDDFDSSGFDFSPTDNQNISVIKDFRFNVDSLVMPELEGRKLHILEPGEKLSQHNRNKNHVIFRQRKLVSLNPQTNANKLEFVLIFFDEKGSRFKVFIDVDRFDAKFPEELVKKEGFLSRKWLQEIYNGLGRLNMEIQESAAKQVTTRAGTLATAMSSFLPDKAENLPVSQYLPPAASSNHLALSGVFHVSRSHALSG